MVFILRDAYGNEVAVSKKDVATQIAKSGCNPFNEIIEVENYNGIIVDSYEDFCNVFYWFF